MQKRLIALILAACLLCLAWPLSRAGADEPIPVFRINTTGKTSYEVGQEIANLSLAANPELPADIDSTISSSLDGTVYAYILYGIYNEPDPNNPILTGQNLLNDLAGNPDAVVGDTTPDVIKDFKNGGRTSQNIMDEIEGMASMLVNTANDDPGDGLLSNNEFWLYQISFDVLRLFACTGIGVYGSYSATGAPIVGRNLDFGLVTSRTIRMQSITVYENEEDAFVNIGAMGMAGCLSGFTDDGLFGAVIESSFVVQRPNLDMGWHSTTLDLRHALESCNIIGEQDGGAGVHPFMRDRVYFYNYSLLLADQTQVVIHEHPFGRTLVNGDPLPARLRGPKSPATISWGGKNNMVAVIQRFVLPPALPYQCSGCSGACNYGSIDESGIADYIYYTLSARCEAPPEDDCYDYVDGTGVCETAECKPNCWEFCNSDYYDFWPGTLNLGYGETGFEYQGYYPLFGEDMGVIEGLKSYGDIKWARLVDLCDFTPNTAQTRASIGDVARIMIDTENSSDPIFAYYQGVPEVTTIQSMVFTPADRRFFLYSMKDEDGHPSAPYLREIGVLDFPPGDANNSRLLDLEDAVLCLQASTGLAPAGLGDEALKTALDGALDPKTAVYVLQRVAELAY